MCVSIILGSFFIIFCFFFAVVISVNFVYTIAYCSISRFDVKGYVTGFGNPDWARTHEPAVLTSPVVLATIGAGATCIGKTVMDEMAYRLD